MQGPRHGSFVKGFGGIENFKYQRWRKSVPLSGQRVAKELEIILVLCVLSELAGT